MNTNSNKNLTTHLNKYCIHATRGEDESGVGKYEEREDKEEYGN